MLDLSNKFTILTVQEPTDKSVSTTRSSNKIKPRFFHCKAATLNCRTASDDIKLSLILRECEKAGLMWVCLQEVRLLGKGVKELLVDGTKWRIAWSGGESKMHGVAICYQDSRNIIIENQPEQISPRLMALNVDIAGTKLRIISAYAPTNTYSLAQKEMFYDDLTKLSKIKPGTKRKLAIFGDFNGSCSAFDRACRFSGDICKLEEYKSSESGDLFLEFCASINAGSLATFYNHKWLHRASFYSNDQRTVRVYDHVVTCGWIRQNTVDCRVKNGIRVDSDHRAVVSTFAFPLHKRDRRLVKKKHKSKKSKKLDVKLLRENGEIYGEYMNEVETRLCLNSEPEIADLTAILQDSATACIPTLATRKCVHPWDDDTVLRELVLKRDKVDRKNKKSEFKSLTNEIRKRAKFLKNQFYENEARKINMAWTNRELEKAYALAKDHKLGVNVEIGQKCDPVELRNHVQKHLNNNPDIEIPEEISHAIPECIKTTKSIPFDDSNLSADAPTKDELITAIINLKNKKSSTDVAAECLKAAIDSVNFIDALHTSIVTVWNEKILPEQWRFSRVTSLFKKGDKTLPENYRTLSVSAVVLKAVMGIVLVRAREWYEAQLDDGQNGFRMGRGTADSVFVIKNLIRIAKSEKKSIYGLAVDLRAAYDWIKRQWVFLSIAARCADSDYEQEVQGLFELVRILYTRTYSYMAGDTEKEAFETSCGLLQGGVESPPLFAIFSDTIMRLFIDKLKKIGKGGVKYRFFIPSAASTRDQRVMNKLTNVGGEHEFEVVYYTGYADDYLLCAETAEELQIMADEIQKLFSRFGLTICLKKTKSLIFNYSGDMKLYPKSIVTILNTNIDNIKVFKYLGVKLDVEQYDTGSTEIKYRINLANNKFREMKHVFSNNSIKIGTRMLFYQAFVRSRLCYLCGLWNTTKKLENKVEKCHMRHLRSMVSGGWSRKGGSREKMDEIGYNYAWVYKKTKIYEISRTDTVLNFVDSQRASWVAHCVRAENDRMIKTTMFDESQNTRKGHTSSTLDQLLSETRRYDMEDRDVYKSCLMRNLFCELENRGVIFTEKHYKIE